MLHACAARLDVMKNLEFFFGFGGKLNKALPNGYQVLESTVFSSPMMYLGYHDQIGVILVQVKVRCSM